MKKHSYRKILMVILALATILFPGAGVYGQAGQGSGSTTASPAAPTMSGPASDACAGITAAGGTCDAAQGDTGFNKLIGTVVNVLTIVGGAVSVIMIIVGGIRYILSNGDSNAMSGAKNTILYAVVGLVVVLLARFVVAFIFTKATT